MTTKTDYKTTALVFLGFFLLIIIGNLMLASFFDFPEILRKSPDERFTLFQANQAFAFYASTRLLTTALGEWAGQPRADAIRLAAVTSAAVSLAIEVFDGYTLEYGFSWQDMAMNLLGVGAGMLLENYPRLDELIDLRLQYGPSDDAKKYGQTNPFNDYSGQTYLLVFKASGVPENCSAIPGCATSSCSSATAAAATHLTPGRTRPSSR